MDLGYYWWNIRRYLPCKIRYFFNETLPWKIAMLLPPKIALFCFVRVFGIRGDCPEDYSIIYKMWSEKYGINRAN